ncbi:DUF3157 family protein [Halioxenophilus sp. WMMB6]|uniref:DUF3157 family protein n=1 Tax=Halioxenophilus sp. WMMB6 TaxID=3073815 RepID=UPI00295ED531|nr:DUF3157 family protein [Halioxenophilus sp. WMMB6]
MSKRKLIPYLLFLGLSSTLAQASETILSGDGREIRLNDDGTWEVVSDNLYLDTSDGRRVILTPDGRWQYQGMAPVAAEETYRELLVAVSIISGYIEEQREKVGSGKNTRTTSFMHLQLQVHLAEAASASLDLTGLEAGNFEVVDKRGERYPVTAINPSLSHLAAGGTATVELVCEGAPGGLRPAKSVAINIAAQVFNNEQPIELELEYDDLERQRINL